MLGSCFAETSIIGYKTTISKGHTERKRPTMGVRVLVGYASLHKALPATPLDKCIPMWYTVVRK